MDEVNLPPSVLLTKLKQIDMEKGAVYHGLKQSEESFSGFGEVYFSFVKKGEVKGWKQHTRMVMNVIVPVGSVRFYVCSSLKGPRSIYELGPDNYNRLTVKPGQWVSFEGVGCAENLVVNIANIEHEPDEANTASLDEYPLDY